MTPETWTYWRIYSPTVAALDAITVEFAAEYVPSGHEWHFLRYVDTIGYHVRLRVRMSLNEADCVHGRLPEARERLRGLWDRSRTTHPAAYPGFAAQDRAALPAALVVPAVYAPETRKWGTGADLARAEHLFHVSSTAVTRSLDRTVLTWQDRFAIGSSFLQAICDELQDHGLSSQSFLEFHTKWWKGPDRSSAQVDPLSAWVTTAETHTCDKDYADLARACVGEVTDGNIRIGLSRLFHQTHLTLNRLGISPLEEGILSRVLIEHNAVQKGGPTCWI